MTHPAVPASANRRKSDMCWRSKCFPGKGLQPIITRCNSLQLSWVALKVGLCNAIQPVIILYGSGMMLQLFACVPPDPILLLVKALPCPPNDSQTSLIHQPHDIRTQLSAHSHLVSCIHRHDPHCILRFVVCIFFFLTSPSPSEFVVIMDFCVKTTYTTRRLRRRTIKRPTDVHVP